MALQVAKHDANNELDCSSDPLDLKTPSSILRSTQTRIPRDFTITADSYISLCARVYEACCLSSEFANSVPESAFQYYATLLLWQRFAQILTSSEKSGSKFFSELGLIIQVHYYFYIPVPLQSYLKGIGHFVDPDGCDRRFVLPVLPTSEKIAGIPYTFGKVNVKTHYLYEALPAPGIAALRIQADINYTKDACEKNLLWDLPEGLRPDPLESEIESAKPTKNLLGWAPAQRLTDQQMKIFEECKIDDKFGTYNYDSQNRSVNTLLAKINGLLSKFDSSQYAGPPKCDYLLGLPPIGSLVQGMTIAKHDNYPKFDRSAMYCEGNMLVCLPYKSNDTLNNSAVISGYRMAKEPIGNLNCWSCYDFNEYKDVPQSWIRTRNTIYRYGSVARLNDSICNTGHVSKRLLQNECILHTMNQSQHGWHIFR